MKAAKPKKEALVVKVGLVNKREGSKKKRRGDSKLPKGIKGIKEY